jgi:hypothetical protein
MTTKDEGHFIETIRQAITYFKEEFRAKNQAIRVAEKLVFWACGRRRVHKTDCS